MRMLLRCPILILLHRKYNGLNYFSLDLSLLQAWHTHHRSGRNVIYRDNIHYELRSIIEILHYLYVIVFLGCIICGMMDISWIQMEYFIVHPKYSHMHL